MTTFRMGWAVVLVSAAATVAAACSSSTSPAPSMDAGTDAVATGDGGGGGGGGGDAAASACATPQKCDLPLMGVTVSGCTFASDKCADGPKRSAACDGDGTCVCSTDGVPTCSCQSSVAPCTDGGGCTCGESVNCCFFSDRFGVPGGP